jgi:hypothetical protein
MARLKSSTTLDSLKFKKKGAIPGNSLTAIRLHVVRSKMAPCGIDDSDAGQQVSCRHVVLGGRMSEDR